MSRDTKRKSLYSRGKWYWNRLSRMSIGEISYRVHKEAINLPLRAGIDRSNVRGIKRNNLPISNWIRGIACQDTDMARTVGDKILSGDYALLALPRTGAKWPPKWNVDPLTNVQGPLTYGKKIDYRDAAVVGNIKYVWELNRHLEFPQLAQAYCATGDRKYLDSLLLGWSTWIAECPFPNGVNWNSSLEMGIRLVNWATTLCILDASEVGFAESHPELNNKIMVSIYQHQSFIAKNLSEYSSANNHLIGEAAGLFVASVTWPFWNESEKWRKVSFDILIEQCELQISDDGSGTEQAIAYLYFVLEFYLIVAAANRDSPEEFPDRTWRRLEQARAFGSAMHDIGGNSVNFGDADDAFVLRILGEHDESHRDIVEGLFSGLRDVGPSELGSQPSKHRSRLLFSNQLSHRTDQPVEKKVVDAAARDESTFRAFESGGYYVLGENLGRASEIRCTVDCGFLGFQSIAAHGHADSLSIMLSVAGSQILVDPGTYAYHTDGEWRDYFRSTAAHNTIVVDGTDQSEIGGPFMWMTHANSECLVWEVKEDEQLFHGRHDGYRRLNEPVSHRREILYKNGSSRFEVRDVLECSGEHMVDQYWHFHPDCDVKVVGVGAIAIERGGTSIQINTVDTLILEDCTFRGSLDPIAGWYSPKFGEKISTSTVRWRRKVHESSVFNTSIEILNLRS